MRLSSPPLLTSEAADLSSIRGWEDSSLSLFPLPGKRQQEAWTTVRSPSLPFHPLPQHEKILFFPFLSCKLMAQGIEDVLPPPLDNVV